MGGGVVMNGISILAVPFALRCFHVPLSGKHAKLMIENTTAVALDKAFQDSQGNKTFFIVNWMDIWHQHKSEIGSQTNCASLRSSLKDTP